MGREWNQEPPVDLSGSQVCKVSEVARSIGKQTARFKGSRVIQASVMVEPTGRLWLRGQKEVEGVWRR